MNAAVLADSLERARLCVLPLPDDLIRKFVESKYFIQNALHIVSDMPIEMDVETTVFRQQFVQHYRGFIEPLQVRIDPAAPGVSVGFLLDKARLFGERDCIFAVVRFVIGDAGGEGEIGSSIERR